MPQLNHKFISHEEYLEMEVEAEYKSEYYHGEIFAMSGASHYHNIIAGNIFAELHSLLRDSDCITYTSDMKIQVDEARHYTYPDVSVVCGDVEFVENRNDTVTNPVVIVEVLSESTADYDRGKKFISYRKIKSLKDYIMVDQYTCHVEYFSINKSGLWVLRDFDNSDDCLNIQSLDVSLPLRNIYRRVEFCYRVKQRVCSRQFE